MHPEKINPYATTPKKISVLTMGTKQENMNSQGAETNKKKTETVCHTSSRRVVGAWEYCRLHKNKA